VLDGTETKSEFMKFPRTTVARLSGDGATISMDSVTAVPFGPPGFKLKTQETWSLLNQGDRLSVHNVMDSFMGPGKMEQTFVFDRR
jgi:hypothetical protein